MLLSFLLIYFKIANILTENSFDNNNKLSEMLFLLFIK